MDKYQIGQTVEFVNVKTLKIQIGVIRTMKFGQQEKTQYGLTSDSGTNINVLESDIIRVIPTKYGIGQEVEVNMTSFGWVNGKISGVYLNMPSMYLVDTERHGSQRKIREENVRSRTYSLNEATIELPERWWGKYFLEDALKAFGISPTLMNPHFMHVMKLAPEEKSDLIKMTAGMMKEPSGKIREAKFNVISKKMTQYGVYMPVGYKALMTGSNDAKQLYIAAVMECFTNTGLYSMKPRSELNVRQFATLQGKYGIATATDYIITEIANAEARVTLIKVTGSPSVTLSEDGKIISSHPGRW